MSEYSYKIRKALRNCGCRFCEKRINMGENMFTGRSSFGNGGTDLYFHIKCFEDIIGIFAKGKNENGL